MLWLRNKKINFWYTLLTKGLFDVLLCPPLKEKGTDILFCLEPVCICGGIVLTADFNQIFSLYITLRNNEELIRFW